MWEKCRRIIQEYAPGRSIDFSEVENLEIVEHGKDRPLLDRISKSELALNLDALDQADRDEIISEVGNTKRSQGRLFSVDIHNLRIKTRQTISDDEIRNTIDFFDQYIGGHHLDLVERSLAVNQEKLSGTIDRDELNQYKRDIAQDYARNVPTANYSMGYNAIHIASGGYFEEGGYMRDIFEDIEERYADDPVDYESIFETILSENPFLVMVGKDNRTREVISDFVRKLESYEDYRFKVEFVDGKAFGGGNREKLEHAVLTIQRNSNPIRYYCEVEPGRTMYRIYPQSIDSISLDE